MMSGQSTFAEIQQQFYTDWGKKPYAKGKGWKQFHRWEDFWKNRLKPDGGFPNFQDNLQEFNNYMSGFETQNVSRGMTRSSSGNWAPIGPFTFTDPSDLGAGLGRVNFIVEDPNNANTLYLGAPAGGVWKSTDAGANWSPMADQLSAIGISAIGISASNSNTLYLATGDADGGDTYAIGVVKSTDGGATWNTVGNVPGQLSDVLVDPANANIVYVCSRYNGVYKSTDGGASWNNILSGNYRDIEFKPNNAQTIYAASSDEIRYSTNGGTTWSASTGLPGGTSRIVMAVTPANSDYVYALLANGNETYGGIYRSSNGGVSFSPRNTNTDVFDGSTQAWYDLAICASSTNAEIVFTGNLNIWKSTNGGTSLSVVNDWADPTTPTFTHADIHFLRYYGGNFYCGSDGGIYKSTNDGTSFTDLTAGVQIGQYYRIGGSQNDLTVLTGGLQDNGGFVYSGSQWKAWHGGDGMEAALHPTNSNIIYGMSQYGTLWQSTNGGTTVNWLGEPSGQQGDWVTPMSLDPNNNDRIIAGYSNLYACNTTTGNWSQLSTHNFPGVLNQLEVYVGNSSIIYVSVGAQIYKTTNGGTAFTEVTNNLNTINANGDAISSIEVDPANSDRVWVTISGQTAGVKVCHSSNGGTSWTNISGALPNINCNIVKLESSATNADAIYVGMDIGVYYDDATLPDFIPFMTNLPRTVVRDLEIYETQDIIRAGTYGRGVWQSGTYSVPSETANFNPSATSSCPSQTITFTDASTGATAWAWDFGAGANPATATGAGPHNVTYSTPGAKTITLTINGGASNATQNVTINALPAAPTISTPGNTAFCQGGSVVLTSSQATGNVWTGGSSNQSLTVTAAGDYTVTYTDANGCAATSAPTTVTVNPLPTISGSGTNPITCGTATGSVQVSGSGTGNVAWTGTATGNQNGVTLPYTIAALTAGSYNVTFTDNNGCTSSVSTTAISDPSGGTPPTISVQGNTTFCTGGSVTLTSSQASGNTWTGGSNGQNLNVTSSGTYSVTHTDANGCSAVSNAITVVVHPAPTAPTVTTSGPTSFCDGGSVTLTSSQASGNTWTGGSNAQTLDVTTSGTYTVTYMDANGCTATSSGVSVTVNPAPAVPTINASGATTFCEGETVTLTSSQASGNAWSDGSNGQTVTVSTSGDYTVTVTDANGCSSTSAMTSVVVNPLPTVTFNLVDTVCENSGTLNLTGTPTGGTYLGTGVLGTVFNPTSAGIGTHTINYQYTDGNGCEKTVSQTIVVDGCLSTNSIEIEGLSIYPNPFNDIVEVGLNGKEFSYSVMDARGRIVVRGTSFGSALVDLTTRSSGVYFLNVIADQKTETVKLIKR